jgi:hypothetical protein
MGTVDPQGGPLFINIDTLPAENKTEKRGIRTYDPAQMNRLLRMLARFFGFTVDCKIGKDTYVFNRIHLEKYLRRNSLLTSREKFNPDNATTLLTRYLEAKKAEAYELMKKSPLENPESKKRHISFTGLTARITPTGLEQLLHALDVEPQKRENILTKLSKCLKTEECDAEVKSDVYLISIPDFKKVFEGIPLPTRSDVPTYIRELINESREFMKTLSVNAIDTNNFKRETVVDIRTNLINTVKQVEAKTINPTDWAKELPVDEAFSLLEKITGYDKDVLEGLKDAKASAHRFVEHLQLSAGVRPAQKNDVLAALDLLKALIDTATNRQNWK